MAHSTFLSLPRELRDMIYLNYFTQQDGYKYSHESGKLRTANNEIIDMSLVYTCRRVADEMKGLALGANTVTFYTVNSDACGLSSKAACFGAAMSRLWFVKNKMITHSTPLITKSMANAIIERFPQSLTLLRHLLEVEKDWDCVGGSLTRLWKPAPSLTREFTNYMLQLLSVDPQFHHAALPALALGSANITIAEVLALDDTPWVISTENNHIPLRPDEIRKIDDEYQSVKYYFSAASSAIKFLKSVSRETRLQMRNIVIKENHQSVAFPECHAFGITEYCQENPHLRIQRRVDMWRAIFPKGLHSNQFQHSDLVSPSVSQFSASSAHITYEFLPAA